MPKIHLIQPDGQTRTIEAKPGESLMQAATSNLVDGIIGECGGCCSCATCHVYVDEDWFDRLPPPDEMELAMLEGTLAPGPQSRLSCQIRIDHSLDGLVVRVPKEQI